MREIRNDGLITIHYNCISATSIDDISRIIPTPRFKEVVSAWNRRKCNDCVGHVRTTGWAKIYATRTNRRNLYSKSVCTYIANAVIQNQAWAIGCSSIFLRWELHIGWTAGVVLNRKTMIRKAPINPILNNRQALLIERDGLWPCWAKRRRICPPEVIVIAVSARVGSSIGPPGIRTVISLPSRTVPCGWACSSTFHPSSTQII